MLSLLLQACNKEYQNPNSPTEAAVLSTTQGLLAASNGLRYRYTLGATSGLFASITATGLTTNELRVVNAGNAELQAFVLGGGNVTNLNPVITNLWTNLNVLNADADKIIANISNVADAPTRNAIQAYAHLFKALAIGQMAMYWEQVIVNSVDHKSNATFEPREQALQKAIKLCEDALALLPANGSLPASFTNVVGNDIDVMNSLNALIARYNMMIGKYTEAITAANKVSLTSLSTFKFDNVSPNPLFRSSFTTNNLHQAVVNLGLMGSLTPSSSDGRLPFYLITTGAYSPSTPGARGFFKSDTDPVPLYLPGEMILIKAEAYARLNDLSNAVTQLNLILQKSNDPSGVNANLPAYSGPMTKEAILDEIYRQYAIELYLTGLRLEISRRFDRPGFNSPNAERKRNFFPYPFTERNNNPNTPKDPDL